MNWLWADEILKSALREDLGAGDVTSALLPDATLMVRGDFLAKQAGVCAGMEVALRCFSLLDPACRGVVTRPDGDDFEAGETLGTLRGPARAVLGAERVALNLLQRMCGIATLASELAVRAQDYGIRIAETRKTMPGLRLFDKHAVEVGSGFSHRFDLAQCIMLKDNHFAISGLPPREMVERALMSCGHTMKVAAEATSPEMALELAEAGADILMLDNFSPAQVREAVQMLRDTDYEGLHPQVIEVTGGITPGNLDNYLIQGVDVISLGCLTHSVKSLDISLEVSRDQLD